MTDKSEWEAKAAKAKEDYVCAMMEYMANGGNSAGDQINKRRSKAERTTLMQKGIM
ncbi:high mobility group protein D-like [Drosophila bipectinata]|uniref:high mobility group protein D-like n=1 Tax=Drosophila bipectinata TaxID=42026 RepID=UPI001C8957B9|nr:high mobility group protein D-like [Drosophila bipectinata]